MAALEQRGMPVPRAVDHNRHAVLMSLVDAYPLTQVTPTPFPSPPSCVPAHILQAQGLNIWAFCVGQNLMGVCSLLCQQNMGVLNSASAAVGRCGNCATLGWFIAASWTSWHIWPGWASYIATLTSSTYWCGLLSFSTCVAPFAECGRACTQFDELMKAWWRMPVERKHKTGNL